MNYAALIYAAGSAHGADAAYRQALKLTGNDAEREFLAERLINLQRP